MRERFPKLGSYFHLIFKFLFIYLDFPTYTEQCDRFFYSNNPPDAVNHLDYLGVQVAWISGPWFLSIFVNIIPWECGEFICHVRHRKSLFSFSFLS